MKMCGGICETVFSEILVRILKDGGRQRKLSGFCYDFNTDPNVFILFILKCNFVGIVNMIVYYRK